MQFTRTCIFASDGGSDYTGWAVDLGRGAHGSKWAIKMEYDLFVIGAGSGGVRAARVCSQLGKRVAVAEERWLGGTCVNVGCVPKKLFYYGSHFSHDFAEAEGFGWKVNTSHSWPTLRDNKTREIERLNGVYRQILQDAGVDLYETRAEVIAPNQVRLGTGEVINCRNILLATGGGAFVPEFPGSEHAVTSDEVFYLERLPKRVLIVGGGYIAVEFACIFNGLGCAVDLSYRGERFLRNFDSDIAEHMVGEMRKKNITIMFNSAVGQIDARGEGCRAHFADGEQGDYDLVLYATGRKPRLDAFDPEALGIDLTRRGRVVVGQNFATSVDSIYALGDLIDSPELTPVAIAEAMVFANHLYGDASASLDYQCIPTAVFTQPSIGTVGLTEAQALASGADVKVYRSQFRHLKHTLSGSEEKTLMKLVVDAESDRVLGVHMAGNEAGEIIQGFAVAVQMGARKSDFDNTVGIHPTAAEELVTMSTPDA